MAFDYSKTGLPANPKWEKAAETCHDWVMAFMGHKYGADGVFNFMLNQPVAAAKRLIDNCPDCSEESVTLALLGPVKGQLAQDLKGNFDAIDETVKIYGQRAVEVMIALANGTPTDQGMFRDMRRLFITEGISTMEDQMVGRKKLDQFHDTRWKILNKLNEGFEKFKGHNKGLDDIFAETAFKSAAALMALDAQRNKPKPPGL